MPWPDRVRRGAYTSPSGVRIEFDSEDVSRRTTKRTAAFEFGGVDGAYVQDNGFGARTYPLRCYFSGAEHDLEATRFELALIERGEGRLEHPLYGTFNVVPFGDIARRDDLVNSGNQTAIEVTFWTTIGALYPASQRNARNELEDALEQFSVSSSQAFANAAVLDNRSAQEGTKASFRAMLRKAKVAFDTVTRSTPDVARRFNDSVNAIDIGMAVLIDSPAQLARATVDTIVIPAEAVTPARDRLAAYRTMAEDVYRSQQGRPQEAFESIKNLPRRQKFVTNDYLAADIAGMGAMAGALKSAARTNYTSRPQAIEAADAVLAQFDELVAWRDGAYRYLEVVDVGAAYQALQSAAATTAGYLVEMSFSLLPERRVTLDRPRTIVDLAAELYGSVDDRLDFLIETNALTGSEILELPAGREITYYV